MTIPKNVKCFANDISIFIDELKKAGFQSDESDPVKNKCFHSSSNKFINIQSNANDFFAIIFPNFSTSEIRQLVSFLYFMKNIISGTILDQKDPMLFVVENGNQGFLIFSDIFHLNINNGVLAIRGECFHRKFIKPLDVEFHDIMYTLKRSFKNNLTFYFEDILEINTALINTMLTESVSDYFWRKNNSPVVKHLSDDDFIGQMIELGKSNIVDSKIPSLKIMSDYDSINIEQLNNSSYVDDVVAVLQTATNFIVQFQYQDLRYMRSFFEEVMDSKSIDAIFQIIDLYVFKQKIYGQFRKDDFIKVFRSNCKKHQKNSLPYLTGLCIQICGLSIVFTDVIKLSDDICHGIDKITSDDFAYVERTYKRAFIHDIEKKFEMAAKDINNKSILVYQMSVI